MRGTGIEETLFQRLFDKRGRFFPSQIFKHHHRRKNDRTRIHDILSGNVGGGSMSRFKNGVPRLVVNICSRSNADAAYHCRQLVGNIVSVQVQRGNHGILFGNQ